MNPRGRREQLASVFFQEDIKKYEGTISELTTKVCKLESAINEKNAEIEALKAQLTNTMAALVDRTSKISKPQNEAPEPQEIDVPDEDDVEVEEAVEKMTTAKKPPPSKSRGAKSNRWA